MPIEYLLRILLALVVGGVIGAEREFRDKAAGFRTIILITVASTLFTILSQVLTTDGGDPSRVAAGIVTGIGFLGAGVILVHHGQLQGLTTAATIWSAAALGMGIGTGDYAITLPAAAIVVVVLWVLPRVEFFIDRQREAVTYRVVCTGGHGKVSELEELFADHGLWVRSYNISKEEGRLVATFTAVGSGDAHTGMREALSSRTTSSASRADLRHSPPRWRCRSGRVDGGRPSESPPHPLRR